MFDMKPIFCQLQSHYTDSDKCNRPYSSRTLSRSNFFLNNDNMSFYTGNMLKSHPTKYPDVRTSSKFSVKEKRKSIELIFKENPKEFIKSKLTANKEMVSYIRHIGSQTDYREESTQTDPFSPVYTISGGEHPEVFALSDFTYGKGLPVTSLEISFIERLRARREWEQDHIIDITRTKIVIEREIREWEIRENQMKMLQDTRQKLFTKNLRTYIEMDEDITQNIIDLFISRQEKQLKLQHERLDTEISRDIRRMKRMYRLRETQINAVTSYNHLGVIGMAQRGNGCLTSLKPPWHTRPDDIITTFKNTTTTTTGIYITCPHYDHLMDRRLKQSRINIFEFEKLLPENALIPRIDLLSIDRRNKKQKSCRRIRDLERAFQLIQDEKSKQLSIPENKPLRFVEKIEKIDHTKQSKIISIQTEENDRRRLAIIKFQNYLRGVIVQSKISNVCKIRQDLLDELKTGLKPNISNNIPANQFMSSNKQIYDYLESATIGDMLDFLSKELLRLQCEQTIHLFILLADRYRYQREAAETGYRTKCIEQRKLEDRAFQEMFSINSNSDIETYMQDLILESISNTADEQARLEIKQITERLVHLIDNSPSTQSDIEAIVSELVHHFLFPTIQRLLTQQKTQK